MVQAAKARVFMSGRSQHVTIPTEDRLSTEEVYIHRDPASGDLVLSQSPGGWREFFAAIDDSAFPDDFLADRAQGTAEEREEL